MQLSALDHETHAKGYLALSMQNKPIIKKLTKKKNSTQVTLAPLSKTIQNVICYCGHAH